MIKDLKQPWKTGRKKVTSDDDNSLETERQFSIFVNINFIIATIYKCKTAGKHWQSYDQDICEKFVGYIESLK